MFLEFYNKIKYSDSMQIIVKKHYAWLLSYGNIILAPNLYWEYIEVLDFTLDRKLLSIISKRFCGQDSKEHFRSLPKRKPSN